MKQINVGIIGFGTVGAGTFEVLTTNREIIANRVGARVVVRKIADLDIETDRGVPEKPEPGIFTTDAMDIILDPDIHVVVEVMGGLDKAREFILKAMENGKHVVTANKALLAEYGTEIYGAAKRHRVSLAFEASVGGGIPIIGALKTGLSGNRIQTCMGILNGTSNYILTKMARENLSFESAVADAVALGFAEDPPTLDVDGTDAAHKLAIMMSIAFGSAIDFDQVFREGIVAITPDDIRFAREFGYHIKLLAIAKDLGGQIEARVHPVMIPKNHILANVHEAFNAIFLEGDFVGPTLYYGLGAGRRPTGSAVVSDIISLARDMVTEKRGVIPPLGYVQAPEKVVSIQPMDELITSYYFRVSALDTPGVLSTISGILAQNGISIYSVIQKGRDQKGSVPIVMLTHEARESQAQKAIRLIDDLDVVSDKTVVIRVEGNNL
jgi:homoserine dehydrogenase